VGDLHSANLSAGSYMLEPIRAAIIPNSERRHHGLRRATPETRTVRTQAWHDALIIRAFPPPWSPRPVS